MCYLMRLVFHTTPTSNQLHNHQPQLSSPFPSSPNHLCPSKPKHHLLLLPLYQNHTISRNRTPHHNIQPTYLLLFQPSSLTQLKLTMTHNLHLIHHHHPILPQELPPEPKHYLQDFKISFSQNPKLTTSVYQNTITVTTTTIQTFHLHLSILSTT